MIAQNYDWDWPRAEREYQRAIQLDPGYATAHQWYAECLGFEGRFDEAFAESDRARKLDPLSLIISADYAALLYFSRQYDRSIEEFRRVLEMAAELSARLHRDFPTRRKGFVRRGPGRRGQMETGSRFPLALVCTSLRIRALRANRSSPDHSAKIATHGPATVHRSAAILMAHVGMDDKDQQVSPGCKNAMTHAPLSLPLRSTRCTIPCVPSALSEVFLTHVRLAQ